MLKISTGNFKLQKKKSFFSFLFFLFTKKKSHYSLKAIPCNNNYCKSVFLATKFHFFRILKRMKKTIKYKNKS
jgi:hypothetical protein